jgi:phosphate/phosphite/phosphonate ABC transporter binding protein
VETDTDPSDHRGMQTDRLVFGLVPAEDVGAHDAGLTALVRWLGDRAKLHLVRRQVESYDALGRQVREGAVNVAWLPPILFVRLERDGIVVPLVANERRDAGYVATMLVRADSPVRTVQELHGKRMAWVDPFSTTGYIVPRLELAARGLDPRTLFEAETFHRSHVATVRAMTSRAADAAATYGRLDEYGAVCRGGWTDLGLPMEDVRILLASGPLPPDLIAVRADVRLDAQAKLADAFVALANDEEMRPIVKRILGVDTFASSVRASYDGLRGTFDAAASSGMIEAATVYMSTDPPPKV